MTRILAALLALLHMFTALGVTSLVLSSRPAAFRCAGHECACRTAARCLKACCCFGPRRDIPPQPEGLDALRREAFRLAWEGVRPCRPPLLVASSEAVPEDADVWDVGSCSGDPPADAPTRRVSRKAPALFTALLPLTARAADGWGLPENDGPPRALAERPARVPWDLSPQA